MKVNTEKCYLLGLLVGGGVIKSNHLQIVLPYNKWGDLSINPKRGGNIAEDILKRAKPLWRYHYELDTSFKVESDWKIVFDSFSNKLVEDLRFLNLNQNGEFRQTADLSGIMPILRREDEFARSFVAGLVDTVGSLSPTHRRFTSKFQIVSLEFKGRNFSLVRYVVELLKQIKCVPDQILWNHPNQHSSQDRYYKSWKKGFKIRVALDDYLLKGSFVFQAKKISADENKVLQDNRINTTIGKLSKIEGRTTLHVDESSNWLPDIVRGQHFIHFTHFTEVLGIPFPNPVINSSTPFEKYICPFTILTKGTRNEIDNVIKSEDYLNKSVFQNMKADLEGLLEIYSSDKNALLFGNTLNDGFPINYILQAIAYIYCSSQNDGIKGKRVLGSYIAVLQENYKKINNIELLIPDVGTCIHVTDGAFSALVGYVNNEFNKRLITVVDGIRVCVREPDFSECVRIR